MRQLIATAAIVLIAAEPLPGTWASGLPMPVACSEVAVATAGNTMYVIGGYANGSVDQSSVLAFHPVNKMVALPVVGVPSRHCRAD